MQPQCPQRAAGAAYIAGRIVVAAVAQSPAHLRQSLLADGRAGEQRLGITESPKSYELLLALVVGVFGAVRTRTKSEV
jgi:hypothetical protein